MHALCDPLIQAIGSPAVQEALVHGRPAPRQPTEGGSRACQQVRGPAWSAVFVWVPAHPYLHGDEGMMLEGIGQLHLTTRVLVHVQRDTRLFTMVQAIACLCTASIDPYWRSKLRLQQGLTRGQGTLLLCLSTSSLMRTSGKDIGAAVAGQELRARQSCPKGQRIHSTCGEREQEEGREQRKGQKEGEQEGMNTWISATALARLSRASAAEGRGKTMGKRRGGNRAKARRELGAITYLNISQSNWPD